jgi:hypothetical protein
MLRIISEQTLVTGEKISVCFIDWQKAFDRVKWIKLMEILKKTGIDQQTVRGSECYSMARPTGDKQCQDWKRS